MQYHKLNINFFVIDLNFGEEWRIVQIGIQAVFSIIYLVWIHHSPVTATNRLFPPRSPTCARRASNLLMFTISVSGEIKIHFISIEHCNHIMQTIKTNNNRWIGETNPWGQPHNNKTRIHNTFIQSSYKGKIYYIEWHSLTDRWAMRVLRALCYDGARWSETNSATDMIRGHTEELQSFNRLLGVSRPHWHCEKWVGCAGVGDCSAR